MPYFKNSLGRLYVGDACKILSLLQNETCQAVIADPPYFQVLLREQWDNAWNAPEEYIKWTLEWVRLCRNVLRKNGLLFIFGQLGKREHLWLHTCSQLTREMQFHDMLIWDRVVGYNERSDSFTPQYEMILVLRQNSEIKPYFDKDAVRQPYSDETIRAYMRDKRYKDKAARMQHLCKGRYATNILRVPSLKGHSKEKVGHPAQKPVALLRQLIAASTRPGDYVLDPFFGSGSTGAAASQLGRRWIGIECNLAYAEMARKRLSDKQRTPQTQTVQQNPGSLCV